MGEILPIHISDMELVRMAYPIICRSHRGKGVQYLGCMGRRAVACSGEEEERIEVIIGTKNNFAAFYIRCFCAISWVLKM